MNLYVCSEVHNLKEDLQQRGYKILEDNTNEPIDAIVCDLKNGGLNNINLKGIKAEGTLIIDTGSKSIEEIENILCNRVYSSLF